MKYHCIISVYVKFEEILQGVTCFMPYSFWTVNYVLHDLEVEFYKQWHINGFVILLYTKISPYHLLKLSI